MFILKTQGLRGQHLSSGYLTATQIMAEVRDQGLVSHLALPSHHPWTNIDQGPLCAVRNKTTPSVLRTFYSPALLVGWVKGKQRRITLAEPSTILANICKPGQVSWPSAPFNSSGSGTVC